ncbi:MAG: amidohydrolase [Candidatus Micrarchaeia archaeon]
MYEVWGGYALLPGRAERDISIAIDGNRIAGIGPRKEMRKKYGFDDSVGSSSSIICPGFIDTHLHSFQIMTRGLTSDRSLLDWLKRYIWKWEGELTREEARASAELAYLELLRSGVTAFVDYTSVRHTEEAFAAAKNIGMRAYIGKTMMDRESPASLEEDTDTCLRGARKLIGRWHGSEGGRLQCCLSPRFGMTSSDSLLQGCREILDEHDLIFTTHANENRSEVAKDMLSPGKWTGKTSVARLARHGLLGRKALLAHCVWLDKPDLERIARSGASVSHCPGSNMMLASGCAPLGRMRRRGVNVCLGSDMGAYYNMSMFEQMRLSVLLQKVSALDPRSMDHGAAFSMATENGAKALSLDHGLRKGAVADICMLSPRRFAPLNDIKAQIVYCAQPADVHTVICDGKVLMRDGQVIVADEERVIRRAEEIRGVRCALERGR